VPLKLNPVPCLDARDRRAGRAWRARRMSSAAASRPLTRSAA